MPDKRRRIALAREELVVGKQTVERARIRVRKTVRAHEQAIAQPLRADRVDVRRIRINRVLERPAKVRQEGDVLIVPVMEEVLEKRLVLKEELHIRTTTQQRMHKERVVLRAEHAAVEREEGPGKRKPY